MSEESAGQTTTVPSMPSDPPRNVTPRARRRAWAEPRVRLWWLLALGLSLVTLYYLLTQYWGWSLEKWLIREGVPIDAKVEIAGDIPVPVPGRRQPPDAHVQLAFDWQGKEHRVLGWLEGRKEVIITGDLVPIRVDPHNPDHWTARTDPPELWHEMIGLAVPIPIILVLIAMSFWRHARVLGVWREGHATPGMVLGVHQTPMAPKSRAVKCTLVEGDNRVFTVYVPGSASDLREGDPLWLITPPNSPGRSIAAVWFE